MRLSPYRIVGIATLVLAASSVVMASPSPSNAMDMTTPGMVTLVQGIPGKVINFYVNGSVIASNVKYGSVVGPLSEPPGIQMASIRLAGSSPASPAIATIRTFVVSSANVIFQSDMTSTGAATFTTILPPSVLPATKQHTWVEFWNGTSTANIDIYGGPTSVPHPLVDTLPINNRSATPQPWCHNSCYDGGIDYAVGKYTFTPYASKSKTNPLMAARTINVQAGRIYLVDFLGSATSKPSTAMSLVLQFAPTVSLSSLTAK